MNLSQDFLSMSLILFSFSLFFSHSGQFPELHARICKTYLDALEGDKGLPTLYGAIVGLSALGNHAVRTLLLPHLQAILSRLQDSTDGSTSTQDSHGEKTGNAGSSEETKQDKGKRKRSDSMDNNNNTAPNPAGGVSSSNGGAKKFNKNSASKVLQEQVTRGMCREALIKALGKINLLSYWWFCFVFFAGLYCAQQSLSRLPPYAKTCLPVDCLLAEHN